MTLLGNISLTSTGLWITPTEVNLGEISLGSIGANTWLFGFKFKNEQAFEAGISMMIVDNAGNLAKISSEDFPMQEELYNEVTCNKIYYANDELKIIFTGTAQTSSGLILIKPILEKI